MEPSSAYEAGQNFGRMLVFAVLGLAALGGGIFFIIALIKAITRKTRGWIIATIVAGVLSFTGIVGSIGAAASSFVKLAKDAKEKKKTMSSKDGRVSIEVPAGWRDMPELHGEAQIQAGNAMAERYVLVLADPKSDYHGTLAGFDQLIVGQMQESLADGEISEPVTREINGYPAIQRRLTGTVDKLSIVYHIALIETDAGFYQILTWTMPSRESAAQPVFQEVIDSFRSPEGPPAPKPPKPSAGVSAHERVAWIVAEQLGTDPKAVKAESRFAEDLGADSLDTVELVMAVEEEFEVIIADEVAEKLLTVGDLVNWLEKPPVEGD